LPPAARPQRPDFVWRPPAVAGDGIAALDAKPRAVVLVDGLFDRYPAIRHKELLALIDAGVAVIGGASMGALRAAELHTLGMIGVGRIFQAYAAGRLAGDDEVAVLHGPEEMGWAPLTLPLVNVRATLARAVRGRIVSPAVARGLRAQAARIFFQERTWQTLLAAAAGAGVASAAELDAFAAWAGHGYVDLKQLDAQQCLAAALGPLSRPRGAARPPTPTVFTDALAAQVAAGRKPTPASS
jgi:hypothetical protein